MALDEKTKNMQKTTVRIDNLNIVKQHYLKSGIPSLRKYIEKLIKEDILKNGSEEIIKKYFKELS